MESQSSFSGCWGLEDNSVPQHIPLFFHTSQELIRSKVVYEIRLLPQSTDVKYILQYSDYLINVIVEPLMCPQMIRKYNEAVMKCVPLKWNDPAEYQGCVSGNQRGIELILQSHEYFTLSECKYPSNSVLSISGWLEESAAGLVSFLLWCTDVLSHLYYPLTQWMLLCSPFFEMKCLLFRVPELRYFEKSN